MNRDVEAKKAQEFFAECLATLTKKANDYAQDDDCFSNFKKIAATCEIPVEKVFLQFIVVKVARLVELLKKPNLVAESKKDSVMDMANYACLLSVYLDEVERSPKCAENVKNVGKELQV